MVTHQLWLYKYNNVHTRRRTTMNYHSLLRTNDKMIKVMQHSTQSNSFLLKQSRWVSLSSEAFIFKLNPVKKPGCWPWLLQKLAHNSLPWLWQPGLCKCTAIADLHSIPSALAWHQPPELTTAGQSEVRPTLSCGLVCPHGWNLPKVSSASPLTHT